MQWRSAQAPRTRARRARVRGAWGLLLAALTPLLALALGAAPAAAATSGSGFYIRGAGFGHGIGMSQYGAAGFALHGFTYQQILEHYYVDTTLAKVSPAKTVTVLLEQGAATFTGATEITGSSTKLKAGTHYGVIRSGSKLELISAGRKIGTFAAPLEVSGSGPVELIGVGRYRGALVFRRAGGAIQTVNAVGVDDYVRGVVSAEMPSSWGMAALEAQAVAARTYVLTTTVAPGDYDAYDDTRSQMYEGVRAETARTNTAVADTSGQVVEYAGAPVTTYYFASSGGYTESIQNVWYGVTPEPWLHGEPDPYDDSYHNPYYRWGRHLRVRVAERRLGGHFRGSLRGIEILQHGVSPRIVRASVVGTKGSSKVTGAELQSLFGTMSTYMAFTTIHDRALVTAAASRTKRAAAVSHSDSGGSGLTTGPGKPKPKASKSKSGLYLEGSIYPIATGATVTVQRRRSGRWVTVASGKLSASGSFKVAVSVAGTYRVLYHGIGGPSVAVR